MITINESVGNIQGVSQAEEIFMCWRRSERGLFVEAYRRMDEMEDALKSLIKMVEVLSVPMYRIQTLSFSPTIHIEEDNLVTNSGNETDALIVF